MQYVSFPDNKVLIEEDLNLSRILLKLDILVPLCIYYYLFLDYFLNIISLQLKLGQSSM